MVCKIPSGNLTQLLKMDENGHLQWTYLKKNVIVHSYVSLPEGIPYLAEHPPNRGSTITSTVPAGRRFVEQVDNHSDPTSRETDPEKVQ